MKLPDQSIGISRQAIATPVQACIVPSRFSWINVGLPELAWGYWRGLLDLGPSPASCDLDCGEERSDCFREGGSRRECDEGYDECRWGCFFNA